MQTVQVGQFKTNFSDILKRVSSGEEFIIEYGKRHTKVAKIVPYKEEPKQRVFGQLKGKLDIPTDFNNNFQEVEDLFYSV
ncbi:prevent-host-death protein [uncultured Candidatus Thioglobus sp.]|nr:prevent-host-death protein [uncultured Candidatus Thioglobus sp.]